MKDSRFLLLLLPVGTLVAACAGEARQDVVVGPSRIVEYVVPETAELRVELPPGEAVVEGESGNALKAEMEIRCAYAEGSCADRAAEVSWVVDTSPERVVVRPSNDSFFGYRDAETTVRVSVPDDGRLTIDMPAGTLIVRRESGCLDVDMMAGDVQVEVAAASVKTAHVDANFGDVSLVTTGDAHEGPRRLLVGAEMDWQEGSGDCALAVDLTFGDVTVTLN